MDYHDIIGIAAVVLWIVVVIVALYFRSKGNVLGVVSKLIALAEETGMPGPDKMAFVVDEMYKYLPTPFRAILTREKLQVIAQFIFDWTRKYALDYLAEKSKKEEAKKKPEDPVGPEEDPEGEDDFIVEYDIVPEICEGSNCPDDACPIFPEKK